MRIERDGPFRIRNGEISDNERRRALDCEQLCAQAALLAHRADGVRVALNIWRVVRQVWNGHELREFGEKLALVVHPPVARLFRDGSWIGQHRNVDQAEAGGAKEMFHFIGR